VCAESDEDRPNVVPDGRFDDPEPRRDGLRGDAVGQKAKHFLLPRREQLRPRWRVAVVGDQDVEEEPSVTVVDRDRRDVNAASPFACLDEESLAGDGPALAR
jgi:hypothetical protein